MKKYFSIIFIVAMLLSGCTQNHGHIGRLFGSWYLYDMTIDGEPVDLTGHGDTFWSFQSNLLIVTESFADHSRSQHYGTWMENDDCLILDFSYTYNNATSVSGYDPPAWIGWPKAADIVLTYLEKSKKTMSLRYENNGITYEYFLKKTI